MTDDYLDRLINAHLDEALTPDDRAEFETLLRESEAARQRFWELAEVHGLAGDAARTTWPDENVKYASSLLQGSSQAGSLRHGRLPRVLASPLAAAVAGLVIGVLSTTAIWAATASGRQELITLLYDSFESGPNPAPIGGPVNTDGWGGDYSEVVEGFPPFEPASGARMLRFLRADYDGKENPVGYVGDLYRVIDLRRHTSELASGDAVVVVEAAFGSVPFEESERFSANLSLNALDTVPVDVEAWRDMISTPRRLEEFALASARRREKLSSVDPWQQVSIELRLPPETRFLLVGLHLADLQAARNHGMTPPAVQFDGQFADDVRVTLRKESNH